MINLMEALKVVEASKDHRVLRRLDEVLLADADGERYRGVFVDCESTGLDVDKDEVIEVGAIPFYFTSDGFIVDMEAPFHSYREPKIPISDEAARVHGLTMDKLKGCAISDEFGKLIESADLVVAHNAGYDRPMLERIERACVNAVWACSQTQVPWKENGFTGSRLEYLLAAMGRFYEAHGAVEDCRAGLFALTWPVAGRPALAHLLEASRRKTAHVWALGAPFEVKDELKKRGYFWNGGEDGRPKAWHKEVVDAEAELTFLEMLGARPKFNPVTARERFTKRG